MTIERNMVPLPAVVCRAGLDDVDDLVPLYRGFMEHERVQPPQAEDLRRRLVRLLASESDEVFIARVPDGAAVGYLQQRYFLSVWRSGIDAFIEDIFVAEKARGRRVGEALTAAGLEAAGRRGARRICLDTNENNTRARRLYERLGFRTRNPAWEDAPQFYYSRLL